MVFLIGECLLYHIKLIIQINITSRDHINITSPRGHMHMHSPDPPCGPEPLAFRTRIKRREPWNRPIGDWPSRTCTAMSIAMRTWRLVFLALWSFTVRLKPVEESRGGTFAVAMPEGAALPVVYTESTLRIRILSQSLGKMENANGCGGCIRSYSARNRGRDRE